MRKNSIKNTRINGEVQKELSNIIRNEIKDPRIGMMTSVTAAEVAPDLKTCKVYISVFGDDEAKKETIRGLKSAEGFIRRMLAKTINLRNTPELTFVLDESIEYGVTMSKLIDEVTHKEDKRMRKMKKIDEILNGVSCMAIAGHVRPDGDCIGSCLGLYQYLRDNRPEIQADVYLEDPRPEFSYLPGFSEVKTSCEEKAYDLVVLLDVSSEERIGVAAPLLAKAGKTICIDHHVTNTEYCEINHVEPDASSACEVLFGLLEEEKISEPCAEALYTGIVTDSGVFQYSSTSPHTMRVAAALMEKGVPFTRIIEDAFFKKTYVQNQIMGRTLTESIMLLDKQCIVGIVRKKVMDFYGLTPGDMDGIVSQLKNTEGVHVAIFLYELEPQVFKVSLRSDELVDVSKIAAVFGGGGHARAAGCTMSGSPYDVINNLTLYIEKQLLAEEEEETTEEEA